MEAIKSFFKRIWDFIRSNAWIQPILFVAIIFVAIMGVQAVGKASQKWSCSKEDSKYVRETLFTDIEEKIENDDSFILYIGYESCSGCQAFQPVLKEFHKKNKGTTIYYLNVNFTGEAPNVVYDDASITTEGMDELWDLILPVMETGDDTEPGKYTPTVAAIKDGEVIKAYTGGGRAGISYSDMTELADLIKE